MRTLIDETSVYQTVLNTMRWLSQGHALSVPEREAVAASVLARRCVNRGYSFFPEPATLDAGVRLPTGEKPRTQLAVFNGVELETLRLLLALVPEEREVRALCAIAEHRLSGVCYGRICAKAECAYASISVLRYHLVRGGEAAPSLCARGLALLEQDRTGDGRHRAFPFYYSLMWLTEMAERGDGLAPGARDELDYMHDRCTTLLARGWPAEAAWTPTRRSLLSSAIALTA